MYKALVVIPLYNHAGALPQVAAGVRKYFKNILIVDDGSTDNAAEILKTLKAETISFSKNKGKGAAVKAAAAYAKTNGFTHILTIDADNQYSAEDLKKVWEASRKNPFAIVIGNRDFKEIPKSPRLWRGLAAFWARVETGKNIPDIHSSLRAYPLIIFDSLKLKENRFAFEMEIIVKSVWAGFDYLEVPVKFAYKKRREAASAFHAFWDTLRLSGLNARLTVRALIPLPHQQFVKNENNQIVKANPITVIIDELKKKENPRRLAFSAVWSIFWATLALPGVRTVCLLLGIGYFNLNRPIALTINKLAWPPFIPAVCIFVGFYVRHGYMLTEFNFKTLGWQMPQRVWEWVLGSFFVAPVFAALVGGIVYLIGVLIRHALNKTA